jgi:hypothetical protein
MTVRAQPDSFRLASFRTFHDRLARLFSNLARRKLRSAREAAACTKRGEVEVLLRRERN